MSDQKEADQIGHNIAAVTDFYTRAEEKLGWWERCLERVGGLIGQPQCSAVILVFVVGWMLANRLLPLAGLTAFDPPPFAWLQGLVGLGALLTSTIVLSRQNRLGRLADQRAHLDLKLTLLTEQKAAKLIDLLEELRRDPPNVRNRHDSGAAALQQSMDPDRVLAALDEHDPI